MPIKSAYPDVVIPNHSIYETFINRVRTKEEEAVALVDYSQDGKCLTFKQVESCAQSCAGFLYGKGLRKGDVVAMCAESCLEYPVITLGILACGATAAFNSHNCTQDELLQLLNISKPKMAVVCESQVEIFGVVREKIDSLIHVFAIGSCEAHLSIEKLLEGKHRKDFPTETVSGDDVAFMLYSSGTTGLPKCIMLTHKNIVSSYVLREIAMPVKDDKVYYANSAIFHVGGIEFIFLLLMEGTKIVMDKEHDIRINFEQAVHKYKVTDSLVSPPNMIRYVQKVDEKSFDMSSLKTVMCGGAPIVPDILVKMGKKLNVKMVPAYGLSEAGVFSFNLEADDHPSSVGTLLPNHEAKVIDLQTGDELSTGLDGEILVRSAMVMKGYLGNDEATRHALTKDGWLHTGDFGHFDEEGRLYITSRIKELIKYQVHQVSPAELESVLLKHSKISDVGVIGIPNKYDVEHPKAFVVKNSALTKDEVIKALKTFLLEKVSSYKQLRGGVEFVDAIPKSVQGKIQRTELKKMAGIL